MLQNGSATATVNADGTFSFDPATFPDGSYDVTVAQPAPYQTCTVHQGSGTFSGDVTDVQVVCSEVQVSTLTVSTGGDGGTSGETTSSTSYVDIDGLAPVTVNAGDGGALLLTLHLSVANGSPDPGSYATGRFAIAVDGQVVRESVYEDPYWSQPGDVSLFALVTSPGVHTVSGQWAISPSANCPAGTCVASIGLDSTVELTATALQSLSTVDTFSAVDSASGASQAETPDGGSTSQPPPLVPMAFPTLTTTPAAQEPVLLAGSLPEVWADNGGANSFYDVDLQLDGQEVGSTWEYFYGQHRGSTVLAMPTVAAGPHTLAYAWRADWNETANLGALDTQLLALALQPTAVTGFSSASGGTVFTGTAPMDIAPFTVTTSADQWVLVGLQLSQMNCDGNGGSGYASILVDGSVATTGYVQSENSNFESPMGLVTALWLPAGSHTVMAQFSTAGVCRTDGTRNLIAIGLQ